MIDLKVTDLTVEGNNFVAIHPGRLKGSSLSKIMEALQFEFITIELKPDNLLEAI